MSFKAYAGKRDRRIGIVKNTGRIVWWGSAYGKLLRTQGKLRGVFAAGERAMVKDWAHDKGYPLRLVDVEPTPHVTGKEAKVHWRLLHGLDKFMRLHAAHHTADIVSGFRTYAKQLALYMAFLAGRGNPANPPGHSKHEATGGYKVARAADTYISGIPFWTWCDQHDLRQAAHAVGLRQPHAHEPWHVEVAGL